MIHRITTEQVILIWEQEVREEGHRLRDRGLLDGVVHAPFQVVFGRVLYPTIIQKAGKLLDGIQRVQAFTDGNKRTAWLAAVSFLQINGQVLQDVPPAEVDGFVRSLTCRENAEGAAATWLGERIRSTV